MRIDEAELDYAAFDGGAAGCVIDPGDRVMSGGRCNDHERDCE
jgi:hypothetical protein